MAATNEQIAGDSRYGHKRNEGYDMQRDVNPKFEPCPAPERVKTNPYERFGPGYGGYGGEKSPDPLFDHLKGIRDDTPTKGRD